MANTKQEPGIKQEDEEDEERHGQRVTPGVAAGEKAISGQKAGASRRLFNTIARLFIWYSIITIAFRCPGSLGEISDTSPVLCFPYLRARSYVYPYIQPYYKQYMGPVDDVVRPYAESIHRMVYIPVSGFVSDSYEQYGLPRVAQAQKFAQHEWDRAIKPQVDHLTFAANQQYNATVRPYVDQIYGAASPYASRASRIAQDQYHLIILPLYSMALPYGLEVYSASRYFMLEIAYPYSKWGAETFVTLVRRKAWPTLRILYGQNVEPQLAKIRERLGSYRDVNKLEAEISVEVAESDPTPTFSTTGDAVDQTEAQPTTVQSARVEEDSEQSEHPGQRNSKMTVSSNPTSETATAESPTPVSKLTEDLEKWQRKFAKAASRGIEDLASRVADITSRQLHSQVEGVGNTLVSKLMDSTEDSTAKLKKEINNVVRDLSEDASEADLTSANEIVRSIIRSNGQAIKGKAQDLRAWKINFLGETESLVRAAAASTLEVLDGIRDLGLQEIGLRWAAMDSVDYKDWEEYHKLKRSFDQWRSQVEETAVGHAGLVETKKAAEETEDRGMEIARGAAEKLVRLRDVANWKIYARDASDDFSDRLLSSDAERARKKIVDRLSELGEGILPSSPGHLESIISAAGVVTEAPSSLIEPLLEKVAGDGAERFVPGPPQTPIGSTTSTAEETADPADAEASSLSDQLAHDGVSASSKIRAHASSVYSKLEGGSIRPNRKSGQIAQSILSSIKGQHDGGTILSEEVDSAVESASNAAKEALSSGQSLATFADSELKAFPTVTFPTVPSNVYTAEDMISEATNGPSRSLESIVESAGDSVRSVTSSLAVAASHMAQGPSSTSAPHDEIS